jgi:hypothetical protein
MRVLASSAALVAAIALGAIGAVLPRVAFATPSLDACTGVLHRQAGTATTITVDAPGTWCLDGDLVETVDVVDTFFAMITVDADDVTIDCRGHRIEYTGSGAYTMYGIGTRGGRQRVTVRNCHLYGFSHAITTGNMDGFLIEDNTVHASRPDYMGMGTAIDAYGSGIVRRNRIQDAVIRAIYARGSSQVLDNVVDGVAISATRNQIVAIEVFAPDGTVVRGNTVRGLDALPAASQHVAVQLDDTTGSTVRRVDVSDNILVHDGSMGDIGVACYAANVLVSDNVLSGFFSPRAFCAETGDNDISP